MNTHLSQNEFKEVPMYTVELTRERNVLAKSNAVDILHTILDKSPVERFIVLYVDLFDKIVGAETISIGSLSHVEVPLRELLRGAIVAGVPKVILAHNHPGSGDAYPSAQDIKVTALAVNAGYALGITVLDHYIIAPNGTHYSIMSEENLNDMKKELDLYMLDLALANLNSKHSLAKRVPLF